MNTNDKTMLEDFGFAEREGFWIFRKTPDTTDAKEAVVVVSTAEDGRFKGEIPVATDAVIADRVDAIPQKSLFFLSSNVKDMVALAQNEVASSVIGSGDYITDDDLSIDFEGIAYIAPFCSDPWGDYQLADDTGLLADPASTFGPLYEEWRDRVISKTNDRGLSL